jgi:DNA-binding CsgD family transcriptional regulator
MDEAELDAVLGAIYEAALMPERWTEVLRALTRLAGGVGSTLVAWNTAEDRPILVKAAGEFHDNEVGQRPYAEHYGALDLTRRLALTHPVGSTFLCHEHIAEAEVRRSEYYNDFLMPQGGRFTIGVPLVRTEAVMASCGTHRGLREGPFGDSERGLFERLAPHLRRALRIQEVLALAETRERAALAALDRLPCAAFVLDRRCRVLAENAAARVLVAARQGLRLRQGVLACDRADNQTRLDAALAAAGGGETARTAETVAIPRPESRHPLLALVVPVPRDDRRLGIEGAAALVLVRDPDKAPPAPPRELLRRMCGLTQAEAETAGLLGEGLSLREVSERRRVTFETARFQLRAVLEKTGCRRQAELLMLLGSLSAGFGG